MLQLVRSKNEQAVGLLFHEVCSFLESYLKSRTPDNKFFANLLASHVVTILIEKEKEPVLTCKLSTYAIEIAKKQWSMMKRKKHEIPLTDLIAVEAEATAYIYQEIGCSERKLLVHSCLCKLSKKCQQLLTLYLEDRTPKEASREMGYRSPEVYQVKKTKCFHQLKSIISDSPEFPELFDN